MMFVFQHSQFLTGETLRYYWNWKLSFCEQPNRLTMSRFQPNRKIMQAKLLEQLSATDAEAILGCLPQRIQASLIARAAEIEYPVEATIEMAIASFLDTEALSFVDCKPGRGQ